MLTSLEGLDHVVVAVGDLDAAADDWRGLGFTLSPRGTHSPHVGTGNHTIMFGVDYVELLGIIHETPLNAPTRAFLARRGSGIERVALSTSDAATGVAALRARAIQASGPVEFSRPVRMPDGRQGEAAFSVFHWPETEAVADLRIFACQHRTREAVWMPALQAHPNTATAISCIEIVSSTPVEAAAHLARLIDSQAESTGDSVLVRTAPGRGEFVFLTHRAFLARHPCAPPESLPAAGAAALVLQVDDLAAAARAAGTDAVAGRDCITVAASRASGVMLVFSQTTGSS